uniref:PIF1/LRR1 pleckstrin homology domain-containing protein n=1 Tax=Onchocerca volvulus TaxID=6282 RepID=A0A8R1XJZ0_ONCVO
MRCSVLIVPRTLLTSKLRQRYSNGILILRRSKVSEISEFELVLITHQNRNGQLLYITRGNVERIFSAKIQWGSVTIEMNNPSVLICIKEASIPALRNFISNLQKISEGEEVILDEVKKVTSSDFASFRKRLVMTSKKQYKEHKLGFPSYLQELIMSNIGLASVDSRWFGATSLHRLDLSGNKLGRSDTFGIKFLNIVRLRHLKVLVLADNEIQDISDDLWNALPENLLSLDLSNNQISYLSPCCTRFPQMTHLSLSHNRIEELPRTINRLTKLKCLDISWNRMKFLPSEIKDLSLEMIDVTAYSGEEKLQVQDILDQLLQRVNSLVKVGSLFEYAAAAILNYGISTVSLPKSLCLMIQQAVENCKCNSGKNYRFYPASTVTARYFIDDARSLAFTTISKGHDYRVILQDMKMM